MPKRKPIPPGTRFARLVVIESMPPKDLGHKREFYVKCLCDCGNTIVTLERSVRHGATRSCGCLDLELKIKRSTKHGMHNSKEYGVWEEIIQRCTNPMNSAWKNYGGRGIAVCDAWRSFERFNADMGPRPPGRYTIERIDNSKGYSPDNCKWATEAEQKRNTRRNVVSTLFGYTGCLIDICAKFGLRYQMTAKRLKRGWTIEQCAAYPNAAKTGPRRRSLSQLGQSLPPHGQSA